MTIVLVSGAKGGVGASLIASNLAVAAAQSLECMLVDMVAVSGSIDLLLGMESSRNWAELLPVADELNEHQLELVSTDGVDTLKLLAAPEKPLTENSSSLIKSIASHTDWLIVDAPVGFLANHLELLQVAEVALLVTTLDPPSLRACKRWLQLLPDNGLGSVELIVNQWTRQHPVDPSALADSLAIPLAAVLPFAPVEVGAQVNFGRSSPTAVNQDFRQACRRLVKQLKRASSTTITSSTS